MLELQHLERLQKPEQYTPNADGRDIEELHFIII